MRKADHDKEKHLKESKKYLHNLIECIDDILNGMPESTACKKRNIRVSAFRRLIFNEKLGYKGDTVHPEDISYYVCSSEELIYAKLTGDKTVTKYPDDLDKTIPFVIEHYLTEKQRNIIKYRYYDKMTLQEISDIFHVSRAYIGEIEQKALSKLKEPTPMGIIKCGLQYYDNIKALQRLHTTEFRNKYITDFKIKYQIEKDSVEMGILKDIADDMLKYNDPQNIDVRAQSIDSLDISNRAKNCLHRNGITTVGELLQKSYYDLTQIKSLGNKTINEIMQEIQRLKRQMNEK